MTLTDYIGNMRQAIADNKLTLAIMIEAIDGLMKPEEIQAYFSAYTEETKKVLLEDVKRGESTNAVRLINGGKNIDDIASNLANDRFSYLLSKYGSSESSQKVHANWKAAIHSLYPLKNLLGF